MKKYNKSEIMKKAWDLFRFGNLNETFGGCLKLAWSMAKDKAAKAVKVETRKAYFTGYTRFEDMTFKFWQGGAVRRIYVNGYRTEGTYIDLNTKRVKLGRFCDYHVAGVIERFMDQHIIAC